MEGFVWGGEGIFFAFNLRTLQKKLKSIKCD
jgi:hypothetical protein